MSFARLIARLATAPLAGERLLTDGRLSCRYSELPQALERIDRHFRAIGLSPGDALALSCINSLPGALTLLYLLQKDYRFLLLPPSEDGEKARALKPVAGFCRHHLLVGHAQAAAEDCPIPAPETFLGVERNAHFTGPEERDEGGGRLYLRTSGSMGPSKITVYTHDALLGNALNCAERFGLAGSDRVAIPVPIFHMYGLGAGFLPALAVGASIDLQDNSNILRYLERERRFQPTVAFLTPSFCEMLLQACKPPRPFTYKRVVTATQRMREDSFRSFDARFGTLVNLYGSTEMGAIAACEAGAPVEVRATTIGKPMPGVGLRVGDPGGTSGMEPAADELNCRHPHGFAGYVDEQGRWLRRMAPGGWYQTGDLAQADRRGHISVLGRIDNSVNRSGYLTLFADIEQALERLDPVQQAVVVAADMNKQREQRLTAFCALKPLAAFSGEQIRAACFECLPRHAVPDQVVVVKDWPVLPSGKVDRQALMAMAG